MAPSWATQLLNFGFDADPNPDPDAAFHSDADPDLAPASQNDADPDPQTGLSCNFTHAYLHLFQYCTVLYCT